MFTLTSSKINNLMCMIYMQVPASFGDLKPYHYFHAKEKVLKITSVVIYFSIFWKQYLYIQQRYQFFVSLVLYVLSRHVSCYQVRELQFVVDFPSLNVYCIIIGVQQHFCRTMNIVPNTSLCTISLEYHYSQLKGYTMITDLI